MNETQGPWHEKTIEETLASLSTSEESGLTNEDARQRLSTWGANELPVTEQISRFEILIHQFKSPLIFLLFAAACIAFLLGEKSDSIVILAVVATNAVIGAFQEGRAVRSIDSLRKLSSLKARVLRGGRESSIAARDLVPGDIIALGAGDAVGADARVISSSSFEVAEATLTGESATVTKVPAKLPAETLLGDRRNMVFAGTYATAGRAVAAVTATGHQTEVGRIARLTAGAENLKTPLEKRIRHFSHQLIVVAVVLFLLIHGIGWLHDLPFTVIFMVGISQIVSIVPEGLPVAMTIALAVAVQRMAKQGAIVRRLPAVEALGSTDVICTDKTGTLTRNEMTVREIHLPGTGALHVTGSGYSPEGAVLGEHETRMTAPESGSPLFNLVRAAVLCNDARISAPGAVNAPWSTLGDPTEVALLVLGLKARVPLDDLRRRYRRLDEIPFDPATKLMIIECQDDDGESLLLIKGAPESVLALCQGEKAATLARGEAMASKALRVLGFAQLKGIRIQEISRADQTPPDAEFLGFVGQMDPPREEAHLAVAECLIAGIRPVMVTGDHKQTGHAIGKMLGIVRPEDKAIDGGELDGLSDEALKRSLPSISVFSRVHPAQKLRIVRAFQDLGSVVAMTGDGVNDAPALAQANVGIAMGITGTDVAKDAARMIITDDNFATIVKAVSEGRLVYSNIKKLILYLFTTGVAEILVLLTALIAGYPPPLAAVQILWINLVTDCALTVTLIMEPPEGDEMKTPPRPQSEPLITRRMYKRLSLLSPTIAISTLCYFIYGLVSERPFVEVQTGTFTVLVVSQWFNALNCRSDTRSVFQMSLLKNKWLVGGLLAGNFLQASVIFSPFLNKVFHTQPIPLGEALIIGALASIVLWVEELRKLHTRLKISKKESRHERRPEKDIPHLWKTEHV